MEVNFLRSGQNPHVEQHWDGRSKVGMETSQTRGTNVEIQARTSAVVPLCLVGPRGVGGKKPISFFARSLVSNGDLLPRRSPNQVCSAGRVNLF